MCGRPPIPTLFPYTTLFRSAQIETVATDIGLDAVKTGMLATTGIIRAIDEACARVGIGTGGPTPFVVDPVAASMTGHPLRSEEHTSEFQSQSNLVCRLLLEK